MRNQHSQESELIRGKPPLGRSATEVGAYYTGIAADGRHNLPSHCRPPRPNGRLAEKFSTFTPLLKDVEQAVIATESFQRLYGVQQMSFGYASGSRGDPKNSAQTFRHSRGMHSMGVHQVAAFLAEENNLPSNVATALRIAALVHDIGHVPFSHSGEYLLQKQPRFNVNSKPFDHDEFAFERILHGDIGKAIDEFGGKHGVTKELIVAILKDEVGLGAAVKEVCDRFDYLARDFAGTKFAPAVKADIKEVTECCLGAKIEMRPGTDVLNFNPSDFTPILNGEPITGERPSYWKFLALRQILFQEYSLHPQALMINTVLELALTEAFEKGKFYGVDFRTLTDREAIQRFLPRARHLFEPDNKTSIDERYQSVGFCDLNQVRDHDWITSHRFAENIKRDILKKFPTLNKWDVFFCATPPYSKTVTLTVRRADGGREVAVDTFTPRLQDRCAFLAVSKSVSPKLSEQVQQEFAIIMGDYLKAGQRLRSENILPNHVNFLLFVALHGAN